jgi:hypothetical protein
MEGRDKLEAAMAPQTHTDVVLLAALYGGAVAGLSAFIAYHRMDERLALLESTLSRPGAMLAMSLVLIIIASIVVCRRWRAHRGSRQALFTLALVAVTIGLVFLTAELGIRLSETITPEGPYVNNTLLLPRDWDKVAAHRRALWEGSAAQYGVFIFDDVLGWTIGANRQGKGPHGETYYSSREGLRVGGPDIALAGKRGRKIALVGDSYTFASDVNYEDSWGAQLEQQLGSDTQVLNFGVPGYGVDQAYLRYERDVRSWHPDVVVLALISHDFLRSTMVYYQVGFPGAHVPGAKPRFAVRGTDLSPVNVPLPRPETVFSTGRLKDLPFIGYDRSYRPSEWTPQLYGFSHFLRLAVSWMPHWSGEALDEETELLNRLLFQTFLRRVREDGAVPVILFLPSYTDYYTDYRDAGGWPEQHHLLGTRILDQARIPYMNVLPCLERMSDSAKAFTSGWHYTPAANLVVAECFRVMLRDQDLIDDSPLRPIRRPD